MQLLKRSLLLTGLAAFALTACKDDDDPAAPDDTIAVTNITVTPSTVPPILVNSSVQLTAQVQTNGGTGEIDLGVDWISSNSAVASVSNTGLVTGVVAGGPVSITARSKANNSYQASVAITVVNPQSPPNALLGFDVTPTSVSIVSGSTAPTQTNSTLSPGGTVTYANSAAPSSRCTVPATGANPTITTVASGGTGTCVVTIIASGTGAGLTPNQIARSIAVTVTAQPTALQSLTVSPTSVDMVPGQTQGITTQHQATAGATVTYASISSNPGVATVTSAGANPTITAVGNGTAQITITATGSGTGLITNSISAIVEVNVQAASVSISSLQVCPAGVPPCGAANLAGVAGQVQAVLNIDSGNQQIAAVFVSLGKAIGGACTAAVNYTEAARQIFGVNGAPDQPVELAFNTAAFNPTTFVPSWFNGLTCIKADLVPASGPAPNASNTIQFTLANPDVVYFNVTIDSAGTGGLDHTGNTANGAALGGGTNWWRGGFNFSGHPVLYSNDPSTPVVEVASITYTSTLCGASAGAAPNYVATFTCAASTGLQNIANAVTINYDPSYTFTTSPVAFIAPGPTFSPLVSATRRAYPGAVASITTREDNVAPTIVVGNVAFNDLFDQMWVNAAYAFLGDFTFSDPTGVGVNNGTRAVRTFGVAGVIPAQPALGCSAANPTVVTGADLSETLTSDGTPEGYRLCATAQDLLGNTNAGSGGTNFFGVDKVSPSVRLAGSTAATPSIAPSTVASVSTIANTTIYGDGTPRAVMPATDVWGVEGIDSRAGFNQNAVAGFPAVQTLARLAPAAPVSCGLFTNPLGTLLSDNWVRVNVLVALDCAQGLGYYTYNGKVVDRAGNESSTIARNFARDHVLAPSLASIGVATVFYTAGAPADFFLFGSDDLEIIEGDISVSYPNDKLVTATLEGITYPVASVGGGVRWDNALNFNVLGGSITVPSLLGRIDFTCTGAAAPYASCGGADLVATVAGEFNNLGGGNNGQNPDSARAVAYDVASNVSNAVATGILGAQTTDVAQQWVGADLLRWKILSTAGVTVTAEHMASTSITAPYFDAVLLGRADVGGTEIRICGTYPAPTLTDNGFNRFWTYSISKPTGTAQCATGGSWVVLGIKNGAALITQLVP